VVLNGAELSGGSRRTPTGESPREEIVGGRCWCEVQDPGGGVVSGSVDASAFCPVPALASSRDSKVVGGEEGGGGVPSWWSEKPEACTEVAPLSENFCLMRRRGWNPDRVEARKQPGHANSPCWPAGGGKFRGTSNAGWIILNFSSPPPLLLGILSHHPQMRGSALTMLGVFSRKKTCLSKKVMSLGCTTHLS